MQPPTDSEIDTFYQTLNSAKLKPAILRIVPEYADQFAPGHLALDLPVKLTQLYKAEYLNLDYISLQSVCEETAKDFQVIIICSRYKIKISSFLGYSATN